MVERAAHGADDDELSVLNPVQSNGAGRPRIGRLHRGQGAGYTMGNLCLRKAAMPDSRQAPSGAVHPHPPCKPPSPRRRQPFPAPPAAHRCGRCGWAVSMTPRSCWTCALPAMASGSTGARTCCCLPGRAAGGLLQVVTRRLSASLPLCLPSVGVNGGRIRSSAGGQNNIGWQTNSFFPSPQPPDGAPQ